MAKFVHDKHEHVYYLSRDFSGYLLKSCNKGVQTTSIRLSEDGYDNFVKMLKDGNWYESTRS